MDARTTWVALSLVHSLVNPREVLEHVASVEELLDGAGRAWFALRWPGLEPAALVQQARQVLRRCEALGVHAWTLDDPHYPEVLRDIPEPPPVLYAVGDPAALRRPLVAMVGARHCTEYGRRAARNLARGLSRACVGVVSGMAFGIDAAAHEGALEGPGGTVAVLAGGPEAPSPRSLARLHRTLTREHLVLSEFAPGTNPRAEFFPRRNRIVAGLGRGVLVVEAADRSGALITARLAREAGRPVLAVPGPIDSAVSRGANRLIRGGAAPVTRPEDVLEALGLAAATPASAAGAGRAAQGSDEERILAALDGAGASVDELAERTGMAVGPLRTTLLRMRLQGVVEPAAGDRYHRRDGATDGRA